MRALILLVFTPVITLAQSVVETKPTRIYTEVGGYYAPSEQTPFWMRAKQFGTIPNSVPLATLRTGVQAENYSRPLTAGRPKRLRDFVGWGYGAEVVVNAGAKSVDVVLPEAYIKGRLGPFEVMGGRRRDISGLADSTVGMGPYVWSGNALPLPKIEVSLPQYTAVPFTNGILAFRGNFAHGWFGNSPDLFIQQSYLHQKALYGRLGKATWPVRFYGGFNHQVQWGGRTTKLPESMARNGQLPSTFRDYRDVIFGSSLGARQDVDTSRINKFDRENRIGNHVGTIDLGLEFRLSERFEILMYRQSVFEDGSLYYLINIQDGLQGIRLRNLRPVSSGIQIKDVVLEYLGTLSQGGGKFGILPTERGRDNYFNHSQYRDGWSYQGRTLGVPFIPAGSETRADLPRYNYTNNNRVKVIHLGVNGSFGQGGTFSFRSSYSHNYGTWEKPFPDKVRQFSAALTMGVPVSLRSGWLVTTTIATDQGKLYNNNTAVYAGVRKTWDFYKYRVRGK